MMYRLVHLSNATRLMAATLVLAGMLPVLASAQPTVTIYTDKKVYVKRETVRVSLSARNLGQQMTVDAYIGYLAPNSALYTLSGAGWTGAIEPWIPDLTVPSRYNLNPTEFFTFDVPCAMPPIGDGGFSWFAAGLTLPGEFDFVSDVSFADFEVQTEVGSPDAFIDMITPNPAMRGVDQVRFYGHGEDSDGRVVGHEWRSNLEGILSTYEDFSIDASELSVGSHAISYRVQDNDGNWSRPASDTLEIVPLSGEHFYVNGQTGLDTNNGSRVAPVKTIGRALNAANPSVGNTATVHVAAGTYSRSTNGELFPLLMRSYVSLVGDSYTTTILDAQKTAFHVITCSNVAGVRVEGFKITGGNAKGYQSGTTGGGFLCENCSPVIRNNMITFNEAINGGGIFCSGYGSPEITDNEIGTNNAEFGGGIMCAANCTPLIENNSISFNTAKSGGGVLCFDNSRGTIQNNQISANSVSGSGVLEGCGGAVFCMDDSSPAILNNTMVDNEAGFGGAICCFDHSLPSVRGNTMTANTGDYGGAIYCDNSSPTIKGNTITENASVSDSSGGGGIHCLNGSSPLIEENTIRANSGGWAGGAILCSTNSSPTIRNNTISDNEAGAFGGGIYCLDNCFPLIEGNSILRNAVAAAGGGGICCADHSDLTLTGNTIAGNTAGKGGGLMCYESSPTIFNNLFVGNEAEFDGGAIFCCERASPDISNNTIKGNSAGQYGDGIISSEGCFPVIRNSIIWDNGDDLYGCAAFYCCIQDLDSGDGNVHDDPLFADGPAGSYYLNPMSPCVDAGNSSAAQAGLSGRTTRADGTPDSGVVDLGYHYPLQ